MDQTERDRLTKVEAQNEEARRVISEIRDDIKALMGKVEALTAEANKGKGALAVFVTSSGAVGAVLGWVVSHITFH